MLKEASVKSDKLWKASGKPRNGPVLLIGSLAAIQYRKRLRDCKNLETVSYTNYLHDALVQKIANCSGNAGAPNLTAKVPVLGSMRPRADRCDVGLHRWRLNRTI